MNYIIRDRMDESELTNVTSRFLSTVPPVTWFTREKVFSDGSTEVIKRIGFRYGATYR